MVNMKLVILNTSVVAAARDHNPTILHPYFLQHAEVVPEDWELAEPAFCTQGVSVVRYTNGIAFTVDSSKLQIVDNNPPVNCDSSPTPGLAERYLRALPHVQYTAVGINVGGFIECTDANEMLVSRFLREGPWNSAGLRPSALGLHFVYPAKNATLHVTCDAAVLSRKEDQSLRMAGVIANGNYHTDLPASQPLDHAAVAISLFCERLHNFESIVQTMFELED